MSVISGLPDLRSRIFGFGSNSLSNAHHAHVAIDYSSVELSYLFREFQSRPVGLGSVANP